MTEHIGQSIAHALSSMGSLALPDWSGNSDLMRRRVSQVLADADAAAEMDFHQFKYRCESPIECVALAGLLVLFPGAVVADTARALKDESDWYIGIVPQMKVHGYRLDFGVLNNATKRVFDLECDGRAYHKNKRKDCARAVSLWRHGIVAFHVGGSALCRDTLAALRPFAEKVRRG